MIKTGDKSPLEIIIDGLRISGTVELAHQTSRYQLYCFTRAAWTTCVTQHVHERLLRLLPKPLCIPSKLFIKINTSREQHEQEVFILHRLSRLHGRFVPYFYGTTSLRGTQGIVLQHADGHVLRTYLSCTQQNGVNAPQFRVLVHEIFRCFDDIADCGVALAFSTLDDVYVTRNQQTFTEQSLCMHAVTCTVAGVAMLGRNPDLPLWISFSMCFLHIFAAYWSLRRANTVNKLWMIHPQGAWDPEFPQFDKDQSYHRGQAYKLCRSMGNQLGIDRDTVRVATHYGVPTKLRFRDLSIPGYSTPLWDIFDLSRMYNFELRMFTNEAYLSIVTEFLPTSWIRLLPPAYQIPKKLIIKIYTPLEDKDCEDNRFENELAAMERLRPFFGDAVPFFYGPVSMSGWMLKAVAMQYLDGCTLRDFPKLYQRKPKSCPSYEEISSGIAECLTKLTESSVVHGDIALRNIMLVKTNFALAHRLLRFAAAIFSVKLTVSLWTSFARNLAMLELSEYSGKSFLVCPTEAQSWFVASAAAILVAWSAKLQRWRVSLIDFDLAEICESAECATRNAEDIEMVKSELKCKLTEVQL